MNLDALITHLRYGTPYHGGVQRDTLDALERLGEAEALERLGEAEALREDVAELPKLDELLDSVEHLRVYVVEDDPDHAEAIDDIREQLRAVRDAIEELRGVA